MEQSPTLQILLKRIETESGDPAKRKDLLQNLRTAIATFSKAELVETLENTSLEGLFECLGSDDEEEIETICGILKHLMLVLDSSECIQKYHDSILQGFQHPNGSVRALVLAQLQRCVETSEKCTALLCTEFQDLIIASVHQLTTDDLHVYKAAADFLMNLVKTRIGSEFLLGLAGIATFKNIVNSPRTSETMKFRIYETLSNFANYSQEHLQRIEEHQFLIEPLSKVAFASEDPLGQLNALEILSLLAESKHGVDHIEKTGLLVRVHRHFVNWRELPMGTLLFPGVLKFIGKVGLSQVPPEELVDLAIDAFLESGKEFSLATVAFETLAFIGSTNEGKTFFNQKPNFKLCFNRLHWLLNEAPTEFRCRLLDALTIIFGSNGEEGPDFLPNWFKLVFPQHSTLFSFIRHSFPEVRLSSLKLLASIAHLEWAQDFYLRIPGVVEFLLHRNIEPSKDCGLAKFQIVTIVAKSPSAARILTPEDIGRMKIHVDQGLDYAEAQAIVAMESV